MAQPSNWIRLASGAADCADGDTAAALLAELAGVPLQSIASAATNTFSGITVQIARQAAAAMVVPDPYGLSVDERAALYAYTLEANPGYRELNARLRAVECTGSLEVARPDFPYTKLLQTALQKLPVFKGGIWRGVRIDFAHLSDKYTIGSLVCWLSFNSCTVDGDTALQFMAGGPRTLFMVDNGHSAVDIREYSSMPESEILLPVGTQLEVTALLPVADDLTIVHLKQVHSAPRIESEGLIVESACASCAAPIRAALGYIDLDVGMDLEDVVESCVCGGVVNSEQTRFLFAPGCKWSLRGRATDGSAHEDAGLVEQTAGAPHEPSLITELKWRSLRLTAAPWSSEHCKGLSITAHCANGQCEAHGRPVTCNLGFRTFDVGMDFPDEVMCNMCGVACREDGATVWLANCRWRTEGREAVGGARRVEEGIADAVPHRVIDPKTKWRALRISADEVSFRVSA